MLALAATDRAESEAEPGDAQRATRRHSRDAASTSTRRDPGVDAIAIAAAVHEHAALFQLVDLGIAQAEDLAEHLAVVLALPRGPAGRPADAAEKRNGERGRRNGPPCVVTDVDERVAFLRPLRRRPRRRAVASPPPPDAPCPARPRTRRSARRSPRTPGTPPASRRGWRSAPRASRSARRSARSGRCIAAHHAGKLDTGSPGTCTTVPSPRRSTGALKLPKMCNRSPWPPASSTAVHSVACNITSAIDTSMCWPTPVRSRCTSAARMPMVACSPAYRSACDTASARGSACSRRAVNSINPSSACITGAYARRLAIGPSCP